jgi:hypothetical protein
MKRFTFCIFLITVGSLQKIYCQDSWKLILKQPDKEDVEVCQIPDHNSKAIVVEKDFEGIHVKFTLEPSKDYAVFKAQASTLNHAEVYFSLQHHYLNQTPFNFNGSVESSETFRQSPHDVNAWISDGIAKQAIPIVALKVDAGFVVALNGSPAVYNNYTSQVFNIREKIIELSSGDNGKRLSETPDTTTLSSNYNKEKSQVMTPGKILPYYQSITQDEPHLFEGLLFTCSARSINGLRRDINQNVAEYFSKGKYTDYFGALSFTTAYMNLRVNETGKSKYWVVPSVEYSNIQYCRDAFWISTMLDADASAQSLKNELESVNNYAEYPLFTILWAYRSFIEKKAVDLSKVKDYVDAVERRSRNAWFYSFLESDGRLDFQYWCDEVAFDKDDVVTYNQGLFALSLFAAREMGLNTKTDPANALNNYRSLFNAQLGFYPVSKMKNTILAPDPLVPDLLAQIYFNKKLLPDDRIKKHFASMVQKSKTDFGFKTLCTPTGNYLPSASYDVPGYQSQANKGHTTDGEYCRGGSFFLYDNLFLIDVYMHGIKEAEDELVWRATMDFKIGNTTFECLNTKTGNAWKPNMGWNVAVYSIWRKLVDDGKASGRLFEKINEISRNK